MSNQSQKHDIWYIELLALLSVLRTASPDVVEISRTWRLLDTMDTTIVRRALFNEATQHHGALKAIIDSRSMEEAKTYLSENGGGEYVAKYYKVVVDCIASLPSGIEDDCWNRLEQINSRCAPSTL
jgi:hypothetical protein